MKRDLALEAVLVEKYVAVSSALDERGRRLWAAAESRAIGYGGDSVVSAATGLARKTVRNGRAEIERGESLAPEHRMELKAFLEHCDLVKFARYEPSIEQIRQTLRMVESFVDNTRSDEIKVDVTEQEAKAG